MPVAIPDSLVLRAMAEQVSAAYHHTFGRPSDLGDPEKVHVLLTALAEGNYRQTACDLAGINPTTLSNWCKKGEEGTDDAAVAFLRALKRVEAIAEAELVADVRRAGKKDAFWAASMTMLERKMPDKYGKRSDDTTVAKVIFQLGARDSDITVIQQTITTNESLSLVPRNELAPADQG